MRPELATITKRAWPGRHDDGPTCPSNLTRPAPLEQVHDHEGSGTATSTRSFGIIEIRYETARVPGWTMIVSSFGHITPQTVHDHETGVLETTHMEKNWEPPP
jgi:hypothetical protein